MYGGGREKKSKVTKRSKLAVAAASAEAEADGAVWQPKPSKRDQFLKSADDTLYLGGGKQKSKRRPSHARPRAAPLDAATADPMEC